MFPRKVPHLSKKGVLARLFQAALAVIKKCVDPRTATIRIAALGEHPFRQFHQLLFLLQYVRFDAFDVKAQTTLPQSAFTNCSRVKFLSVMTA